MVYAGRILLYEDEDEVWGQNPVVNPIVNLFSAARASVLPLLLSVTRPPPNKTREARWLCVHPPRDGVAVIERRR